MYIIPVRADGDTWINRDEVLQALNQGTGPFALDLLGEGPSLRALGVIESVTDVCHRRALNIKTITVINWHNSIESVPFEVAVRPLVSHFFWISKGYRQVPRPITWPGWALMIGHARWPRSAILWQLHRHHGSSIKYSLMQGHGYFHQPHDDWTDWIDDDDAYHRWWQYPPFDSLDRLHVRDHYRPDINANASLIDHYNFAAEIVLETFCHGPCFFPTEKTVRPLSQKRALLVYGPRNYLSNLKRLGFRTWDDIWDETYDLLEGADRWNAMKKVIDSKLNLSASEVDLICDIGEHNLEVLDDIIARFAPR